MKSDDLGHHFGARTVERHVHTVEIVSELQEPSFDAEETDRLEPRSQQSLSDEHSLGDDQSLALREVGAPIRRVEIAKVIQPGVGGIVLHAGRRTR